MTGQPFFHRYVALGDSTTEGLIDPDPNGGDRHRGWADRLAERLARINPALHYANLAIRGRKLPQIRAEQLDAALEMEPDLASVLGGINDILRSEVDLDARAEDLDAIVDGLRETGATVLLCNYPDIPASISFAGSRIQPRVQSFNLMIGEISERHGAVLVDLDNDEVRHPAFWAPDRLHASPVGHQRIAALAAHALGLDAPDHAEWQQRLPEPAAQPRPVKVIGDLAWAGRHLTPWILRRIRGVSSGDGIEPKRPRLAPVEPLD